MANRKISQLTALTTPAAGDYLPIVDISEAAAANQNKRITIEELLRGAPDGTAAAPGIAFESDGGNGMFLGGTDILAFSTGGTQAVTIDASQRLGVGTSLPSGNLDVRGISGTTIIRAVGADSNGNADAEIFSTGTTGSSRLYFSDTAAQSGSITYAHSNNSFAFATNGSPAVTIDSSQRVGIGTSSPGSILEVKSFNPDVYISNTFGTGQLRIGSFTNGTFIGTYGDNGGPSDLMRFGTASGSEKMRLDGSGRLLIGTSSAPSSSNSGIQFSNPISSASIFSAGAVTSNVNHILFVNGNGGVGSIVTSGSATAYNTSSDYRLKENVTTVTDGIARLQQLKPSRFNFIADPNTVVDGFIAHEVQAVVPEAITGIKDAVDDDGNPVYQGIDQSKLVPLLTAALQEAIAKIETLEAKVSALEAN